ncbi:uncharacterized protein LOC127864816 [Dreissena polymorpha]|uniref:B box-type domain-containing protein n=1 Tax=Dreissena polymorpha TaxID=45954 RepID=A0A9D4SBV5_DREPO|nr:uncharacterized protein LOC127864816 [Dreissena polymorpha]KAH3898423.1 hypothetical protein DPMN_022653 [Dreissena polymorpha]
METGRQETDMEVSSDMIGDFIVIKSCEPCTRKNTPSKATIVCITCKEYLCEPCRNIHIIYNRGKHDTAVIGNPNSAPVVLMMKGMDICRDHDKNIKFFCEDHSKLCCSTCAFIHRKCDNVNELASLSSQEELELQELKNMLLKLKTEISSIMEGCKLSEDALSETNAHFPKQFDELKERFIEIFDKAKKNISDEVDNFESEEVKLLGEWNKASSKVNEDINHLLQVSSVLVEHGTPQQKYIITIRIKEKIQDIEIDITEQRNKYITSNVSLEFSKQLVSLLREEEDIATLKVERQFTHKDVVQPHPKKTQETSQIKQGTTELNKATAQLAPIKPVLMELLVSVDIKQTGDDGKRPRITGLDFLPDGRLVVVDNMNGKCILMNDQLQRKGTPYKFNTVPFDVVCLSQGELAVTMSDKTVCLLTLTPDNAICLIRKIYTSTRVFSICCMNPTNMVVSTYDDLRPVRIITQAGKESDFDHVPFPKKEYKHEESKCTYVPSKNTLVLTDRFAHTVYMYDTVKGTSRAITHDNIKQPIRPCIGPDDTVLVCSGAKNSIVRLTVEGEILDTYSLDMEWPYALCMNKDGNRLAVSAGSAIGIRKLRIYNLS